MNSRKVMRNFGYGFYQRIQGYTSTLLCYAIFCVIILNIIGWMQMRHHLSTLIMLMFAILSLSIICIITIIKASQLQHTSSGDRNMILNDRFLKERNLMEKISDNHQKMRMIKAKTLQKKLMNPSILKNEYTIPPKSWSIRCHQTLSVLHLVSF